MSERTLPEYVEMLKADDPEARRAAVVFLTRYNDPEMLRHIEPLAADPDAAVRYYVKKALASLQARARQGQEPASPKIGREARERIESIQAAVEAGDRDQLESFLTQLAIEENRFIRATLIKALGRLGDVRVAAALVPHLKDPDSRVVANTVEALEEIGDPESQVAMLELLTHPDTRVKGNVAKALWTCSRTDTIGSTLILDRLREMLESDKPWYRESAVYVLGRIGSEKALSLLRIALSDSDPHIREMAAKIFQERGEGAAAELPAPGAETEEAPRTMVDRSLRPERLTHVMSVAADGGDSRGEWLRRIWDPQRPLRENMITAGLLLVFACGGLFVLLVLFNLAVLIARPPLEGSLANPSPERVRQLRAEQFSRAGRWEKLLALLSTATDLTPQEKRLLEHGYETLCQEAESRGELAAVRRLLTSWNSALPDSPKARIRLGEFLLRAEGATAAEEYFRRALAMDETSLDAWLGLGDSAWLQEKYGEAEKAYARALKLDGRHARALFAVGNIRARGGDLLVAEEFFRKALAADPLHSLARYGLARVRLRQGDASQARLELERVLALDPSLLQARIELARLLVDREPGTSLEHYRNALEIQPDDLELRREFARHLFAWKLHEAALKEARIVLADRQDGEMASLAGAACLALERPGEAKEWLEKAIALQPDNGQARYHRALLREAAGDREGAAEDYRAALAARYEEKACYMNLAQLEQAASRFGEALTLIEAGLQRMPEDPQLLYNRGVLLYLLERRDDARAVFLSLAARPGDELRSIMDRIRYFMGLLGEADGSGPAARMPGQEEPR